VSTAHQKLSSVHVFQACRALITLGIILFVLSAIIIQSQAFASIEVVVHGVGCLRVPTATHTMALRLSSQTMIRRAECSRSIAVPMVCLS